MKRLNQKGVIAQVLILLILAAGLVVGIYLVKNPAIFSPKARAAWLTVKDTAGNPLPFSSTGIPQTTNRVVILNVYSLLGIRSSVSSPTVPHNVSVKIAESPTGLQAAASIPFSQEPVVLTFSFSDPNPGQKFIWAEFLDSVGRTERRTAEIELLPSSVSGPISPAPTPTSMPSPSSIPSSSTPPVGGGGGGGSSGGGGGGGGGNTAPAPKRIIGQIRYAEDVSALQQASWEAYTPGVKLSYTFKDINPGTKFIFVQFRGTDSQIVKINGQDYISSSIDLVKEETAPTTPTPANQEEVTVGSASLSTDSVVTQRGGNWGNVAINLTLSGFSTPGRSIAGLFVRNQVGQCSINDCGYIGWTQIRSYGTNGTDITPWTTPGSLSSGVHMFGVFSLNADGTAGQLLAVSSTNFGGNSSRGGSGGGGSVSSCQANVTTCSCGDTTKGRTDSPGKCYPECNGGWCNGGICATCQP